MLESGMNVAKFKLSSSSRGDKIRLLGKIQKAVKACCAKYAVKDWPIATCIELKTCIVKTGLLDNVSLPIIFNFTLYTACSRIGRGSLVLRHSAPHFPLNSGGIAC